MPKHIRTLPDIGPQTILFIQMYFRKPSTVLLNLNEDYMESGDYTRDMVPVHFLRQKHLNQDLYDFLQSMQYPDKSITPILDMERINPKEGSNHAQRSPWRSYFTPETFQDMLYKERFLLRMMKDLGI